MKSLIFVLSVFAAAANAQETKTFTMKYELLNAKAVCFALPCFSRGGWDCDETTFEIWYDPATYARTTSLAKNETYRINAYCSESHGKDGQVAIPFVDVNMYDVLEADKANGTNRVAEILEDKGSNFPLMIYTRVKKDVDQFVQEVLEDSVQDDEL
ncbi:MAG: hypothetical protein AAF202_01825 [Pseudomonadota bacterium]